MTFLWALLVSAIGAISFNFGKRETSYWLGYGIKFACYLALVWLIQYHVLTTFDAMRTITWILVLMGISNGLMYSLKQQKTVQLLAESSEH